MLLLSNHICFIGVIIFIVVIFCKHNTNREVEKKIWDLESKHTFNAKR